MFVEKDNFLELRRQLVHMGVGLFFILIALLPFVQWWFFAFLLFLIYLFLYLLHEYNITPLQEFLASFERKDSPLPCWGLFAMTKGFLVALLLFPQPIALAACAMMVFGDGVATLVGYYFGRLPLRWNGKKTFEGAVAGLIAAVVSGMFFVSFPLAVLGSMVAILIESVKMPHELLDDNFIMPLLAGLIMLLFSTLFGW